MRKILLALALILSTPVMAQDAPPPPKVQARLVAESATVPPGGTVTVALAQQIAPGWHTYWSNPGDAGAATELHWTLPPGWSAGPILWPRPQRLPVPPFMNYGYETKVWLLTHLTAPADAKAGDRIMLHAKASWLVCRQVCIPEDADLTLPLIIGAAAIDPGTARDFAAARALLPVAAPWKLNFAVSDTLDLYVAAPALAVAHPRAAVFFPQAANVVDGPAEQAMGFTDGGMVLRLKPGPRAATNGPFLDGVLVLTSSDGSVQAISVHAPPGPVPAAAFAAPAGDLSLAMAILFAILGGLILNVMPCVLPILAMKALALSSGHGARESFAYAAGAVLSFLVFGLAILLLRQGGAAVGWGFQLQQPLVVAGFALLIFAVGLNLSGLFEVGSITAGGALAARGGSAGAFFTGVLAVAVAAPCTAPFMAAALGVALTLPMLPALAVFAGLGFGFALPFLLLGVVPGARRFIPRPGPWMLRLKQVLAFPMYGTAVFLVWVLAAQVNANGIATVLAAMVALAFAAWLWSVTRGLDRGRGIGAAAALLVLLAALYAVSTLRSAPPPAARTAGHDVYSPATLASLRAQNRPVFIDATAAWCITCLVNEDGALKSAGVTRAFADRHIAYLVADWTSRDDAITQLLKQNGRSGVPLYLYYAPGAASPVVLPQILTETNILAALNG
jgi:thiol:disulfide interchange protein DsbD